MTTQFDLWFEGGTRSVTVDAPKVKKDHIDDPQQSDEEIDGLEDFVEYLSSCEWFYSRGQMIHVRNIDMVTLVRERSK